MTVIAHSYLLAKKYILELASDRTFYTYAEQTGKADKFVLTEKDKHNIPANVPEEANDEAKKAYKKLKRLDIAIKKTDKQMDKLYLTERYMMSYATLGYNIGSCGHEKKWSKHNPFAFEAAVVATPFVLTVFITYGLYSLAGDGFKALQNYVDSRKKEKKAKLEEQQETKRIEQEEKTNKERLATEKEIAEQGAKTESEQLETVLKIIAKSQDIKYRNICNKPDKGAIIMGLALPEEAPCCKNVKIKIDKDIYAFFYTTDAVSYDNHTKPDDASNKAVLTVFYKNPENGNYHQIARLVARNSLKTFFNALEHRQNQLQAISAYKQSVNKTFEHIK